MITDDVIYKYPIRIGFGKQKIKMPLGAEIIKLALQNDIPTIWAIVYPEEKELEDVTFITRGTGHPIENSGSLFYIDTYFLDTLVYHVFKQE